MKLSEAIRLGAMLHPQHFGDYYDWDEHNKVIATCALGAAGQAGYKQHPNEAFLLTFTECPVCAWNECLRAVVAHLNDGHRWTREDIADWVAVQEGAEVPVVEAV